MAKEIEKILKRIECIPKLKKQMDDCCNKTFGTHTIFLKDKNTPFEFYLWDDYKVTSIEVHPLSTGANISYLADGGAYNLNDPIDGGKLFSIESDADETRLRFKVEKV